MENNIINLPSNENKTNNNDIIMEEKDSHQKKMELLDKMMDEITFSDDEDEEEKNNNKFILDQKSYNDEMTKINKLYDVEEGVDEGTMNSYTGTRNEIINELERKDLPVPFEIGPDDRFEECGKIKNIVENKILMAGINNNISKVLNLDNIIFLQNRQYIGFIDDVVGKIDSPIYVIKIYPKLIEQKIFENIKIDDKLYYCSNRANIVNAIELKNKSKGCDASNAFDEEVSEGEKDYSDDEEEISAKIKRKNNRKNKKKKIEENNMINELTNNNIKNCFDNSNQINNNQGNYNNSIINAPYTVNNLNKSKEELNKQIDIFVNNAINLNMDPFSNPFQ